MWSVYSYFCWKQLDQSKETSLLEGLQVRVCEAAVVHGCRTNSNTWPLRAAHSHMLCAYVATMAIYSNMRCPLEHISHNRVFLPVSFPQDLVRVAGGSRKHLMGMATRLGVAKLVPSSDADTRLVAAARTNDTDALVAALADGGFPDTRPSDGMTALHHAVSGREAGRAGWVGWCVASCWFGWVGGAVVW